MQVIFLPTSICVIWYLQIKPFVIVTLTLDGEKAACNKQEAKKKKTIHIAHRLSISVYCNNIIP